MGNDSWTLNPKMDSQWHLVNIPPNVVPSENYIHSLLVTIVPVVTYCLNLVSSIQIGLCFWQNNFYFIFILFFSFPYAYFCNLLSQIGSFFLIRKIPSLFKQSLISCWKLLFNSGKFNFISGKLIIQFGNIYFHSRNFLF